MESHRIRESVDSPVKCPVDSFACNRKVRIFEFSAFLCISPDGTPASRHEADLGAFAIYLDIAKQCKTVSGSIAAFPEHATFLFVQTLISSCRQNPLTHQLTIKFTLHDLIFAN